MSQSLSRVLIHLIFGTKKRERCLAYPALREQLDAYMVGILRNIDSPALQVKSVIDHVHILYVQSRTRSVSDVVGTVKRESSAWIKTWEQDRKDPFLMKFAWQTGYAAFSVSESKVMEVKRYIQNQEEHHRRATFQDEYREFLTRHGVQFDEKYVWD